MFAFVWSAAWAHLLSFLGFNRHCLGSAVSESGSPFSIPAELRALFVSSIPPT